jgi:hypothetical protein
LFGQILSGTGGRSQKMDKETIVLVWEQEMLPDEAWQRYLRRKKAGV